MKKRMLLIVCVTLIEFCLIGMLVYLSINVHYTNNQLQTTNAKLDSINTKIESINQEMLSSGCYE